MDTLVICPPKLQRALQPWVHYRSSQGHGIRIRSPLDSAEKLSEAIRADANQFPLRWLVLVGDAPPLGEPDNAAEPDQFRTVTHAVPARVNLLWGSEAEIASDNPFADIDGDQLPDLAVGRLPVDNADELRGLVRRIMEYETSRGAAESKSRLDFVAGVGGFGLLEDKMLETVTRQLITAGVPASYNTTMTYASWQSPYCPDPRQFGRAVMSRLDEGSLFWVYIGHGSRRQLDRVVVPGASHPIMDHKDAVDVHCRNGSPIAVFLACYTGAFDDPEDCLAEKLLKNPRGPIAVYAGSRVTMPYAMAVMGESLLRQVFQARHATLGEVVLHAKRELGQSRPTAITIQRRAMDLMARTLYPREHDLVVEREEHLALFNLLGDPLLRIPYPEELPVRVPGSVTAGDGVRVAIDAPHAGQARVAVLCQRGQFPFVPPTRLRFQANDDWLNQFEQTYQRANRPWWLISDHRVHSGPQELQISIPPDANGSCVVQVLLTGRRGWSLGSSPMYIRAR